MSDRTDRSKLDPQAMLEAERRGLIAHRDELTDDHERIVRHIGEGRELLRRMIGHGEEATLTIDLYQRQALPELLVSREQALEALVVLLGASEAIGLILDRLAISDLAHLANHEEAAAFDAAIEETDAALVRLASQTAESFEHTQEPVAAQARAAS